MTNRIINRDETGGIPIIWIEPEEADSRDLVIWLPGFSSAKEDVVPQLIAFADAGFFALSFDPDQHGERAAESKEQLLDRVRGNIRRHFWPILAKTAEEVPRTIDYAVRHLSITGTIMAGGISMGGDIAVAACGVDSRISAAVPCLATPDWLRPGSHEQSGAADEFAQACYNRRNPLTHISLYSHRPAISFQCGELDTQVPPAGAETFLNTLRIGDYRKAQEKLELVRHPSVGHSFTDIMLRNAVAWFQKHR